MENELILWLTERRNNARAIAQTKRGADRDGWIEDSEYFDRAIAAVSKGGGAQPISSDELCAWFAAHVFEADVAGDGEGMEIAEVVRYTDLRALLDRLIPAAQKPPR